MARVSSTRLSMRNMCINGDFEYAPTFTAATTGSSVFIDGTAGGSTTNNLYKWAMNKAGTVSAQFDPANSHSGSNSLKIAVASDGGTLEIHRHPQDNIVTSKKSYCISVAPSTAYTCTYWYKAQLDSGSCTNGARLVVLQFSNDGTTIASASGTYINTTVGWTQDTITFTTGATVYGVDLSPRLYNLGGAANARLTAWFDDIMLYTTTPAVRTAA
jgi:WD40 repeat protein